MPAFPASSAPTPPPGPAPYCEISGDGPPLLLLHGGFCSLESLRGQAEALAAEHRVFAYERPGHGRTPDISGDYHYDQYLAEAVAFLDVQGLGAVDVLGYSDGAIIGLLLALHHPERVRSLIAISGNLDPSAFTADAGALPVLGPPVHAPAPDPAKPDVEREHYGRLSPDGPEHADVVLAKLFRLWTSEPQLTPAALAAITAPTLIVAGDRDSIRPDHSLLMAGAIPGAQLCLLPGAGHDLVATHPVLLDAVVQGFLRQLPPAP